MGRMKIEMKYAKVESMIKHDFEMAKEKRDFRKMADAYEMLLELWSTGKLNSEEYHRGLSPMIHCFTEVKGDKIYFPSEYKSCAYNYSKKVIYSLESDSIKIVMNSVDDERIFDYFKEEGIETRYVILDNCIKLSDLAKRTLQLHNNDIVELCIDDEMIAITKES